MEPILYERKDGIATLTLNRPDARNAMDEVMIEAMRSALKRAAENETVRVLIVRAEGAAFCAGGDLNWMRRAAGYNEEENIADAQKLADMLYRLQTLNKPTIAMVQGAVYGGGVGLACACDVALGLEDSAFCLSEVKLGLIPSVISPYVLGAIGPRQARRFYQTAEVILAEKAQQIGFLHEVYPTKKEREAALKTLLKQILSNAPQAMSAAKTQIFDYTNAFLEEALVTDSAERIAQRRASDEAKEGISAFLEKRKPNWTLG